MIVRHMPREVLVEHRGSVLLRLRLFQLGRWVLNPPLLVPRVPKFRFPYNFHVEAFRICGHVCCRQRSGPDQHNSVPGSPQRSRLDIRVSGRRQHIADLTIVCSQFVLPGEPSPGAASRGAWGAAARTVHTGAGLDWGVRGPGPGTPPSPSRPLCTDHTTLCH
jgi:hypothetical protein